MPHGLSEQAVETLSGDVGHLAKEAVGEAGTVVGEVDALLGVLTIGDVFAKFIYLGLNIRLRRMVGRRGRRNGLFDFYLFTFLAGALFSFTGRKDSEGKEKKKKFVHGVGKLGQICGAVSQPLLCAFRASIRRFRTAKIEKLIDMTKK